VLCGATARACDPAASSTSGSTRAAHRLSTSGVPPRWSGSMSLIGVDGGPSMPTARPGRRGPAACRPVCSSRFLTKASTVEGGGADPRRRSVLRACRRQPCSQPIIGGVIVRIKVTGPEPLARGPHARGIVGGGAHVGAHCERSGDRIDSDRSLSSCHSDQARPPDPAGAAGVGSAFCFPF